MITDRLNHFEQNLETRPRPSNRDHLQSAGVSSPAPTPTDFPLEPTRHRDQSKSSAFFFWNDSNFPLERIRSLSVHCERLNHQQALAPLADPVRLVQLHAGLSEADKGALAELYEYMPRSFVLPDDAAKLQRWLEDLRDAGERRFIIWKPLEPKSIT